jgi:hypothetical protein
MSVIDEIAAERRRQIEAEGWTPEHDSEEHQTGDLARAAACYAISRDIEMHRTSYHGERGDRLFPSDWEWKPKDRRRDLIRAAALIVAEIERLDRARPTSRDSGWTSVGKEVFAGTTFETREERAARTLRPRTRRDERPQ